ncbi:secreted LysM domain-containing protein [Phycomyces blakesleeanus]
MKFTLFTLSALALTSMVSAAPANTCVESHVASKGQTCSTFSSKYHITVKQLQTLNSGLGNNGKNCTKLVPGKTYCTKATVPKKSGSNQEFGDNQKSQGSSKDGNNNSRSSSSNDQTVAKSGETTQSSTATTNDASHLAARAIIECKKFHVVKTGDTCKSIAKDNHIPEVQLTQLSKEKSQFTPKDHDTTPKNITTVTPPPCNKLVVGKRYCIAY